MAKRLSERFDVQRLRLAPGADDQLIDAVRSALPEASAFHVLTSTPGQGEDLFIILVNGRDVVRFELPSHAGAEPTELQIMDVSAYRHAIGQGKSRQELDLAVADAKALAPRSAMPLMSEVLAVRIRGIKEGVVAGNDLLVLHAELAALISEMDDREAVYSALDQLRADFLETGDEPSEDLVLELMDFVLGWCSPHMRL